MDITKEVADISTGLAALRTKIQAVNANVTKAALDPKADVETVDAAMKARKVIGKIDTALKSAEGRIAKATKPRAKKAKKESGAKK